MLPQKTEMSFLCKISKKPKHLQIFRHKNSATSFFSLDLAICAMLLMLIFTCCNACIPSFNKKVRRMHVFAFGALICVSSVCSFRCMPIKAWPYVSITNRIDWIYCKI